MSTKRIGLLLAGHVDPKSQHIAGDYPELFRDLLAPLGIVLRRYDVDAGRFPDALDECDGWLCSPSRRSVYEDLPWIRDLEQLHRDLIAQERPYVGVCFGHQLLAQALGGRVERNEDGWGVGVQDYELLEPQPWMGHAPPKTFSLIASHEDQVIAPPADARVIARADYCPIAALAVGERAWTVQGHPEFVPALADHLLAGRVDLIGRERVEVARASLDRHLDRLTVGRWIADFFDSVSS
jgi:GMP synthase-like glutamine amidotransferase